jgi:hypothetical protein
LKRIINELRIILDDYSILSFNFSEDASKFKKKTLNDIIDSALDDPNQFKTSEQHLPKGESIKWELDSSGPMLKCVIAGRNNEVKA